LATCHATASSQIPETTAEAMSTYGQGIVSLLFCRSNTFRKSSGSIWHYVMY